MEVSQCSALIQRDRTVILALALGMDFVRFIRINISPASPWAGDRKRRLVEVAVYNYS